MRGRLRTVVAMIAIGAAQLAVTLVPFHRWRGSLGTRPSRLDEDRPLPPNAAEGQRTAAIVERAAQRMPFQTKCLPRAVALSWLLRRKNLPHSVVFAVRPADRRQLPDALHAWVEINGAKVIGELPGPWVETLRLGG